MDKFRPIAEAIGEAAVDRNDIVHGVWALNPATGSHRTENLKRSKGKVQVRVKARTAEDLVMVASELCSARRELKYFTYAEMATALRSAKRRLDS